MNRAEARLAAEECVRIFLRLDAVEVGQFVVVKQPGIAMIESKPHSLCNAWHFFTCTVSHFQYFRCCLGSTANAEAKFLIAEVTENDFHVDIVHVRWYTPSRMSREKFVRTNQWHKMSYELELVPVQQRGRQNAAARYRMAEQHQEIPYADVSIPFFLFFILDMSLSSCSWSCALRRTVSLFISFVFQCHFGFSKLREHGGLSAEVQRKLVSCGVAEGVIQRNA